MQKKTKKGDDDLYKAYLPKRLFKVQLVIRAIICKDYHNLKVVKKFYF